MKQFEHEVLSFDTSTKKSFAKMQETLREWGLSGFEIVSVVTASIGGDVVKIFLKRELQPCKTGNNEAA